MFYQTRTARRPPKGPENAFLLLVTLTFKLGGCDQGTKYVCRVNLAQIGSADPDILYTNK